MRQNTRVVEMEGAREREYVQEEVMEVTDARVMGMHGEGAEVKLLHYPDTLTGLEVDREKVKTEVGMEQEELTGGDSCQLEGRV